jgi:hypothetical protein
VPGQSPPATRTIERRAAARQGVIIHIGQLNVGCQSCAHRDTGVFVQKLTDAPDEESGAGQKHDGEGDLTDDEEIPRPACAAGRSSSGFAKCLVKIHA